MADRRSNQAHPHLPMMIAPFVVCRECLPGYDFESMPHVVSLLDEYLNTFSCHWTVVRACRVGLSRRALEYLAARDPDWDNGLSIAEEALIHGFLHVLQWLNECYPDRTNWGIQQIGAFSYGELFYGYCSEAYGHLSILQWLHNNRGEGCTEGAMENAVIIGRLDIIQWLHANRSEGCTARAMKYAALYGHLGIVKWLHEHRNEGCSKEAMDVAAACGHLGVVEWLHTNRSEGCTKEAMTSAAAYGHLDVVRFLHENRREGCSSDAMRLAARNGHVKVVRWLYENRCEGHPGVSLRAAATFGQSSVVEYLSGIVRKQRRGDSCIHEAARIALENGHAEMYDQLEQDLKRQRLQ